VPSGSTVTIIATYSVPSTATGTVVNSATASTTTPESNSGSNSSTVSTALGSSADMKIGKTGPANLVAGSTVTYTLTITNAGPSDATGVTVDDPTPAGLNLVSTSVPCGTFPCVLGNYPVGTTRTYTVTYSVPLTATGTITNTATIAANESDPSSGNNSSSLPL